MSDLDKPEFANGGESAYGAASGTDVVLVYMTFPDVESAATAGEALVARQLAACVNIIPGMLSIYRWKGQLQRDGEVVMIVKTRGDLAELAMAVARERHPYDNPAMLTVPVSGGAPQFLDWIATETRTRPVG